MSDRLQFGLVTDQNMSWPTLVERWRLFESLGFDSAWDCDHYVQPSRPTGPYFEAWTLLAGLAARTDSIRLGVMLTLLAVNVNASPILRLKVPTEIFNAPPLLPKSKLALRLLRLDVNAVDPGNNTTLAALTATVPLKIPVEFT